MAFDSYGFDSYIDNLKVQFEHAMSNREKTPASGRSLAECKDRKVVVENQIKFSERLLNEARESGPSSGPSVSSTSPHYPSFDPSSMGTVSLEEGNCVGISDLFKNIGVVMAGKYFLCRTITPATKYFGMETAVEDIFGKEALHICLNNVFSENAVVGKTDFEDVLPIGSYLLIKNPLFTSQPGENLGWKLHCDNPADFEVLSEKFVKETFPEWPAPTNLPGMKFPPYFWTRLPTNDAERAKALKYLGDKALAFGRSYDALRWYSLSLEHIPETENKEKIAEILANKGAALITISCWYEGLKCIEDVINLGLINEKVLVRKAKCLIKLQKYEETLDFLNNENDSKVLEELKNNVKEMIRLRSNQDELREAICKLNFSNTVKEDVIPDFQGNIDIGVVSGKGRGVIATKGIEAGTIVLVTRALAFVSQPHRQDLDSEKSMNLVSKLMTEKIANMIHFDKEVGPEVYQLTAGKEMDHIEREEKERNSYVDLTRIQRVLRMNQFGSSDYETDGSSWRGLWTLPAFINHSCSDSNCAYTVKGDIMIVKVVKELNEGEELLLPYISGTESFETRSKCHTEHEFKCDCRLCAFEEELEGGKQVGEVLHILKSTIGKDFSRNRSKLMETLGMLQEAEALMKKAPLELRLYLLNPGVLNFAVTLFSMGRFRDCKELLLKQFEIIEANPSMFDYGMKVGLNIIRCLINERDRKGAVVWVKKIKEFLMKSYGTIEVIKGQGDSTLEELKNAFGIEFFK